MAHSTAILVIFALASFVISVNGYSRPPPPPYRRIYTRRIVPIKPMNYTIMNRAVKRLPPLNPDAEFITSSSNKHRFHPEKIMERVTQSEIKENPNKMKKNPFNYMNFDAYLVKPAEFNYKTVWATLEPETEKLLKSLGNDETTTEKMDRHQDVVEEPTTSSSRHRCKYPYLFLILQFFS